MSTEERIEPLAGNRHGSPNFSYKVRPSYIDILATISQLAVTALYAPEMLQGGVGHISGVHGQNSFQSNDLIPTGAGVPSHRFHRKLEISPSSSTLDREHDFVPRTPSSLTIAQIEARYDMLLDRMKHICPQMNVMSLNKLASVSPQDTHVFPCLPKSFVLAKLRQLIFRVF